jgi:hypothetical protein
MRRFGWGFQFVVVVGVALGSAGAAAQAQEAASIHARIAADYAPRVRLHPDERYALSNVDYFFSKFRLVLKTNIATKKFDVTPTSIAKISLKGMMNHYTTIDPKWKDRWSFESKDGCEWSTRSPACDVAYLRAENPIAWAARVTPEVYWRATERAYRGHTFVVIQYFFLLMLNDAHNKHDGEWESSVVVVDKVAYLAAGADVARKRAALWQILMAGHYRHEAFGPAHLAKYANDVFVEGTAHYKHVMSMGGHGGYLVVPASGKHESAMKCYEKVRASDKKYDTWTQPVKLVQVTSQTPWIRYAGRWGRAYGLFSRLPMKFSFGLKPVGDCEGSFGLGWIKERFMVIGSAPYGPMFIHQTAWNWKNFPAAPGETPKNWR